MFTLKVAGAIALGLAPTAVGVALCATVIGIPLGVAFLYAGALPLVNVIKKHNQQVHDKPLDQGAKPWQ